MTETKHDQQTPTADQEQTMTTNGPFVIIYPAHRTGDPAAVPMLPAGLNPAGIPFVVIEGCQVADGTVALALDYPGRVSA